MKNGGARPGSGRKPGSVGMNSQAMRKLLVEFAEMPDNRDLFFEKLRQKLEEGNDRVLTWYGDQVLGRAIQTVELGEETRKLIVLE